MGLVAMSDRSAIEAWLRRDPSLHLYELGDLDDFFWPDTTWYGLDNDGTIDAVALLYSASALPVLVVMGHAKDLPRVRALLEALAPVLPRRFYAHLPPGSAEVVTRTHRLEAHGTHDRMVLGDRSGVSAIETRDAFALGPSDAAEVSAFYAAAYPAHWFEPRMLDVGAYFALRRDGKLASIAGVHVLSRTQRVAALGNIATDPALRGQGLARIVTARVCQFLAEIDPIGLNVDSANAAAIALYRGLGFERRAVYEEHLAVANDASAG